MSKIKDTIYDLPNEEYHRGERFKDFLSSTQIKDYMGRVPAPPQHPPPIAEAPLLLLPRVPLLPMTVMYWIPFFNTT